jgi:hypothetical protein
MKYGLYLLIFGKNNTSVDVQHFECDSIEECKNKILINIKNKIDLDVDYPFELEIFCGNIWNTNELFRYKIFHDDKWFYEWSEQEIYENVLDIINKKDIQDVVINELDEIDEIDENN